VTRPVLTPEQVALARRVGLRLRAQQTNAHRLAVARILSPLVPAAPPPGPAPAPPVEPPVPVAPAGAGATTPRREPAA